MNLLKVLLNTEPSNIVFLCGAGISFDAPASLPTVNRFVFDVLKECGAGRQIMAPLNRQIKTEKVISRFEVLIDEIRRLRDPQLKVALNRILCK